MYEEVTDVVEDVCSEFVSAPDGQDNNQCMTRMELRDVFFDAFHTHHKRTCIALIMCTTSGNVYCTHASNLGQCKSLKKSLAHCWCVLFYEDNEWMHSDPMNAFPS